MTYNEISEAFAPNSFVELVEIILFILTVSCAVFVFIFGLGYRLGVTKMGYPQFFGIALALSLFVWFIFHQITWYYYSARIRAVFRCNHGDAVIKVNGLQMTRSKEFADDFIDNRGDGLNRMTDGDTIALSCRCNGDSLAFKLVRQNEDSCYYDVLESERQIEEARVFRFKTNLLDEY